MHSEVNLPDESDLKSGLFDAQFENDEVFGEGLNSNIFQKEWPGMSKHY